MRTWFIILTGPDGREQFKSCKRGEKSEALAEAALMAAAISLEKGEDWGVGDVRPLRGKAEDSD